MHSKLVANACNSKTHKEKNEICHRPNLTILKGKSISKYGNQHVICKKYNVQQWHYEKCNFTRTCLRGNR